MLTLSGLLYPDRLAAFVLVTTRLAVLLMMAPPLGGGAVPAMVRLAVVIALSVCLCSGVAVGFSLQDLPHMVMAIVREAAIAFAMALGLNLAFAAFTVGARVLDTQMGYGIGQIVNPLNAAQMPVLTGLFAQAAVILFVCADGVEGVLRGFVMSLQAYPPGADWNLDAALPVVLRQVTGMFTLGFALVAPVATSLLLVEVALGMLSRSLPQVNMFAMGLPVKLLAGLAAVAGWITLSAEPVRRIHASLFSGWEALFR